MELIPDINLIYICSVFNNLYYAPHRLDWWHCHGIIYSGIHYLLLIYYRLLVHLGKEKRNEIEVVKKKKENEIIFLYFSYIWWIEIYLRLCSNTNICISWSQVQQSSMCFRLCDSNKK